MPRARNPARDKAYQMWLEADGAIKLKDIAASLGVPEVRVRKWKSEDKWEEERSDKKKRERSSSGSKSKSQKQPRNKGGQPGNKNAAGKHDSSSLIGNTNALKHGAFSSIVKEMLSEEEQRVMSETEMDTAEEELASLYAMLNLKEVRLMRRIQDLRNRELGDEMITKAITASKTEEEYGIFADRISERGKEELGLDDEELEDNADAEEDGGKETGKKPEHKLVSIGRFADDKKAKGQQISRGLILDYILKLEAELDRVHSRKMKVVKQIEDIRINRERLEIQKAQAGANKGEGQTATAWVAAVMAATKQGSGE